MPEIDLVVKGLIISKDGTVNFDDLYKTIKSWLDLHHYRYFERNYEDITKTEAKDIKIKFECERKIDDYMKFVIELTLKISDHKFVVSADKKKKLVEGNLTISFGSGIQTDYEGEWEDKPVKKFFRGIYDKFVEGDKRAKFNEELKEETYSIYNEIKAFLNLQRF